MTYIMEMTILDQSSILLTAKEAERRYTEEYLCYLINKNFINNEAYKLFTSSVSQSIKGHIHQRSFNVSKEHELWPYMGYHEVQEIILSLGYKVKAEYRHQISPPGNELIGYTISW